MGLAKATLPFGSELMLQRVVRLLGEVVSPIVVVAAQDQVLPPLASDVLIARDVRGGRGPLEGLLAGLLAIAPHADAAYATSCDVPLLSPAFVRCVISRLGNNDIAVPVDDQFHHPLAAVYRTSLSGAITELLARDQLRPVFLFDKVKTQRIPVAELAMVDPALATLENLNRPEDYRAALETAGLEMDPKVEAQLMSRG